MIFFACIVVLGSFVHTQTLNPRSVNVALETVLEFDGKHNSRDVKAIDKLQNYLNRIKKILTNNEESRRSLPSGFKFRDFLKSTLQTIASYDDNDLLDVVAVVNNEIRKYHYKGCRFYELVENQNMRRDMAENLVNLNDLTAKELRAKMNKAAETLESDAITEQKRKMLDYLDSVYVGNDIKTKMEMLVSQLDQFKKRSKRANLNLAKVINQGLRSIIFDHYSNLNMNARKELKDRLETLWRDYKNSATIKDVWKKTHTTKAFSISVNNFEIVYPKKDVYRSKSIKRAKKNNKHLEPRFKTDIKRVKRTRPEFPNKEMPKIRLRKKTNRFKKYNKKDKLRTLKPSPVLMIDRSEEDVSVVVLDRMKSKLRLDENRKKQKKGRRKRKHQYIATEPMLMHFRNTRRSNDYDDNSDDGLHIQSFEKPKTTNSLRKSFPGDAYNDTLSDTVKATAVTPNVIHRIDKIEKVLDEIKNLVSLRRKANILDEEITEKPKPLTTKRNETESTVTTTQTTKITLPVSKTTTQEKTTEESTMKSTSKPQTTKMTNAPENYEDDTKILIENETKSTKTSLKTKTESSLPTKEMTTKYSQLESTLKTTLNFDLISNDTRRSDKEHVKNKSRSVREAKMKDIDDHDIDIRNTKHSNDNFKDIVKEKLKSIKEHDLTDRDKEPRYNKHNLKDNYKGFDSDKIGKYHEFSDVKHSKEHDLNNNFEAFVNGKTKFEKESEFSDLEKMQNRRSNDEFRDYDKEKMKFGKEHDHTDEERHNKPNLNNNFKHFEHDNMKFDKEAEWTDMEGHPRENFKGFDKNKKTFRKDNEIVDAEGFSNYNFHDNKDFDNDNMKFDMEHHSKDSFHDFVKDKNLNKDFDIDKMKFDMEHHSKDSFNDFAKDKMELGKENGLTDIERMHKSQLDNFKEFDEDKLKTRKEKLTDHDVESMYDSHRALKNKDKGVGELSDLDIEHMYNETRRAHFDKIIDKNSKGDREMDKRVRERIAGHMKNFMDMKKDGKAPNKFDFNIEDPFNLKEDDLGL